jgi:hypothetical protein
MTHHEKHEDDPAIDSLPDDRAMGDERPSESSPNPTQQRIAEETDTDKPVDVGWDDKAPSA